MKFYNRRLTSVLLLREAECNQMDAVFEGTLNLEWL